MKKPSSFWTRQKEESYNAPGEVVMQQAKRDYYKILGVCTTSTTEEIKKAYRSASKKYHPDLNPNLKLFSEEKMRELVEAYEVISDSDKRKEYDKQPQFQLRKGRQAHLTNRSFTKTTLKKEESLLERLFSPFRKKTGSNEAARIDPKEADTHFTLGLTMAQNSNLYEQAIEEFRVAAKFDPNYTEAFWNLGIVYYRKGLFDEAVVNFQKVIALKKDDILARKMIDLLRDDIL
jgi:curved DNA-binding protein CbpA